MLGPFLARILVPAWTIGLGFACDLTAQQRSLTLDDVIGLGVISDARLSPDGTAVAYVLLEPDAQRPVGWRVSLWRVDVESAEASKLADDAQVPRWSPDGRRLAFISRVEGAGQIWILDMAGGDPVRISDFPTGVAAYEWSPDGTAIAFAAVDPTSRPPPAPVAHVEGLDGASHQLYLLDTGSGETRRLTRVEGTVHLGFFGGGSSFSWSPDGARIAFAVQPGSSFEDAFHSDVLVVRVADGSVRDLVVRGGLDFRPLWSPDGGWIAFTSSLGTVDRLAGHGLSVVAADGGELRDIGARHGEAFLNAPAALGWSVDGRRLYYEAPRRVARQLVALDVDDGDLVEVTAGQAVHTGFSFSADGSRMAFLGSEPGRPYDVFVSPTDRFAPRRITSVNDERLRDVAMPTMEVIDWERQGGSRIEGVLVKPPDFEAGRAYPLVVWLHGGPEGHAVLAFDPTVPFPLAGFDPSPIQLLAARGYLMLLPNFRGSAGYGLEFVRAVIGMLGPVPLEDVSAGIDQLVAGGMVDPHRVGLMGWASGAYKVAHAITASDRFAAAALGGGPTDLWVAYGEGDFPVQWESLMGGAPWDIPERYDRDSPLRHAHRSRTPTLIMHGEEDRLVPPIHSRQLHTMLRGSGVTTALVTYPGQGHGILHPRAREDAMRRIIEWFDRWLHDDAR